MFRTCFSKEQQPLLRTPIRDGELDIRTCFLRKQKPLLGRLIRDGQLISRSCFSQKTKAPARNADPRRIACVSHLSSRRHGRGKKLFTLLGPNCHPGGQICCGADFGSRIKISGHPLGQSASFFEIYLLRLVLGGLTPLTAAAIPESRLGGVTPPQQPLVFSAWWGYPPSSTRIRPGGVTPRSRSCSNTGPFWAWGG